MTGKDGAENPVLAEDLQRQLRDGLITGAEAAAMAPYPRPLSAQPAGGIIASLRQQPLTHGPASARIVGDEIVMSGPTGVHKIGVAHSSDERFTAHWVGFCAFTDQYLLGERLVNVAEGLAVKRDGAPATHHGFWQDRIDQVEAWRDQLSFPQGELRPSSIATLAEFERMAAIGRATLDVAPTKPADISASEPGSERGSQLDPEAQAYLDDLQFIGLDEIGFHDVISCLQADNAIDDARAIAIAGAYSGEDGGWTTRTEALGAIETEFYAQHQQATQNSRNSQDRPDGRSGGR